MCIRDRRNDYYTDIIFSAYVENVGDAVLLGGRYDNLLAQFDAPMPAVGFGTVSYTHLDVYKRQGVSRTQYSRLRDSGLDRFMKGIFVSEDAGYQKPMKEYFDYCLLYTSYHFDRYSEGFVWASCQG